MMETPHLTTPTGTESFEQPQAIPEKPPATPPPLRYESDTLPNVDETAELDELPETYFELRHETLDENRQTSQPSAQGMVPLSQVIADYPTPQPVQTNQNDVKPDSSAVHEKGISFYAQPVYRKALSLGFLTGLATAATLILFFVVN